jgi:hypothetical protein
LQLIPLLTDAGLQAVDLFAICLGNGGIVTTCVLFSTRISGDGALGGDIEYE